MVPLRSVPALGTTPGGPPLPRMALTSSAQVSSLQTPMPRQCSTHWFFVWQHDASCLALLEYFIEKIPLGNYIEAQHFSIFRAVIMIKSVRIMKYHQLKIFTFNTYS